MNSSTQARAWSSPPPARLSRPSISGPRTATAKRSFTSTVGRPPFDRPLAGTRRPVRYNSHSWRGEGKVYNPFDLLLLFQTGYLTTQDEARTRAGSRYRLGYPNREVQQCVNESLLDRLVQEDDRRLANSTRLERLLEMGDIDGLKELFQSFFASIPYQWYTNNDIAEYEGYYASVFYSYFAGLGFDIRVEDSTSHGRLDMAVRFAGRVYLFEFKVVELEPQGAALEQLRTRRYADKYRVFGEPIHLVAVEFSKTERNIAAFESEQA